MGGWVGRWVGGWVWVGGRWVIGTEVDRWVGKREGGG